MDQNYPLVRPVLDLTIEPIIPSVQPSNVEAAVHATSLFYLQHSLPICNHPSLIYLTKTALIRPHWNFRHSVDKTWRRMRQLRVYVETRASLMILYTLAKGRYIATFSPDTFTYVDTW